MQDLSISRNKFGVRIREHYFANRVVQDTVVDTRYDLIVNYCTDKPEVHNCKTYTSLIDLEQPEETIFKGFRESYRRDIRSVCNDFITTVFTSPHSETIQYFCGIYNGFADMKNLPHCNEEKLKLFARQKTLIISQLNRPDDNAILCTHAYIHDGKRSRLLYSVSRFREFGKNNRKLQNRLAKAHRYLHWSDIKQFKCWGFSKYDLGGITMDRSGQLSNVSHFKSGFGGVVQQEFVNAYPQSIRGWLAMKYLLRQL